MAVTLVQSAQGSPNFSPGTAAFSAATTNGNTIVVGIPLLYGAGGSGSVSSITDDGGNTYTADSGSLSSVSNTTHYGQLSVQFFYVENAKPATTITVTLSTSTGFALELYELTPCTHDQSSIGTGTGSALSCASKTPSQNGAFACALGVCDDGIGRTNDISPGSGWTLDRAIGGGNYDGGYEHIAQATAAALTGNMSLLNGDTGQWVAGQIIFVPSAPTTSATASDTLSLSSSATGSAVTHSATASDTLSLSDTATSGGNSWLATAGDTLTLTDSATGSGGHASGGSATAGDSLALSSTAAGTNTGSRTASDSLSLSSTATATGAHSTVASDTLTISSSATGHAAHSRTAGDSLTLTSTAAGTAQHNLLLSVGFFALV